MGLKEFYGCSVTFENSEGEEETASYIEDDGEYILVQLSCGGYSYLSKANGVIISENDPNEDVDNDEEEEPSKRRLSRPSVREMVDYLNNHRGRWCHGREICDDLGYDYDRAAKNLGNVAKKVPRFILWEKGTGMFKIRASRREVLRYLGD